MNQTALSFEDATPVVLAIDDCVDVHRLLSARLKGESVELVSAFDGEDGLERARATEPSLVLLDLDMPGMDGFEVLRALKEDPKTLGIPVIVLSGIQTPHDKVTAFDLGAVDYVTKPFEMAELRARVRSALRLNRLVKMLAERAQIDGLTGLWNRAYFDKILEGEVGRSVRHQRPLSLALLDVDHFKSVNDAFGHPAGDIVLQELARIVRREARASDICCRYGGEEFAIILPDTVPQDAFHLLERIRESIEQTRWAKHPSRSVTISGGLVGASDRSLQSAAEWVEVADRCLYRSKAEGRNRITVEDLSPAPRLSDAG